MKKITILLLPLFFTLVALAQTPKQKIVKIMYKSIPVSQYCIPKSQTISRPERGSDLDLLSGYKTYYDLFINLDTRSSIYTFDSLVPIPLLPSCDMIWY